MLAFYGTSGRRSIDLNPQTGKRMQVPALSQPEIAPSYSHLPNREARYSNLLDTNLPFGHEVANYHEFLNISRRRAKQWQFAPIRGCALPSLWPHQ
jgi:hypothetical protein